MSLDLSSVKLLTDKRTKELNSSYNNQVITMYDEMRNLVHNGFGLFVFYHIL